MNVFNLFRRRGSAPVARERLQILLAHERAARGQPDLLAVLQAEIMAVIAKHVSVEHDNVHVRMDRGITVSTLEIDVEIPNSARIAVAVTAITLGSAPGNSGGEFGPALPAAADAGSLLGRTVEKPAC